MNWKPFLSKLQKIKVLAENAESDGQLSKLEQDLLASYIREMYELLYADTSAEPVKKQVKAEPVIVTQPEVVVSKEVETPVVIKTEPVLPIEEKVEIPVHVPVAEPVEPAKPSTPIFTTSSVKSIDPSLLAELFAEEKVTDLSDKLASQKINDLTKAMGINERIFTIQELFNNDNGLFSKSMENLNQLPDFSSAKNYLTNELIPVLDWTSDKKIKKAATFIKLVRRRYMS